MSGRKKGGSDGRAPGGGGYTKSGKPRPGTGGNRKDRLQGKGPTPPAHLRTGHPAQRAASARAAAAAGRPPGKAEDGRGGVARNRSEHSNENRAVRGSGDEAEVVAGRNSVVESLRAGVPAVALYVTGRAQQDERVAEAVRLAADAGVAVLDSGLAELDRLTGGAVHQGVALRVRPYDYAHPEDFSERTLLALPLIVALDGVTDPRNLGAVVRSAAAFGATGVVVPARRSAGVTAGAWKASAGALARLPVARAVNLSRTLRAYQEAGFFVAGLDAAGETEVRDMPVADGPLVLVVGSEGRGLSRVVAAACDLLVRIPMAAGAESLNAGVAASIAMYEIAAVRSRATLLLSRRDRQHLLQADGAHADELPSVQLPAGADPGARAPSPPEPAPRPPQPDTAGLAGTGNLAGIPRLRRENASRCSSAGRASAL